MTTTRSLTCLSKRIILSLTVSLFGLVTSAELSRAAIISTPGLTAVRFWEASGPILPFTFAFNSPQMTIKLGNALSPANRDFSQFPAEPYDVFYSDSNGAFNLNGNYVTVEAAFPRPLPAGGGLNLGAVDLIFGSSSLRADVLSSWVGLGNNYIAGSEVLAVDTDTAIPSTFTTMGHTTAPHTQHLRVTVTWSKLVPEPAAVSLLIAAIGILVGTHRPTNHV
ncbi:hypothetical protein [Bythopirellula polymerisocia]|uniref:PEP-CTERM protein-sorting domain-containing protein n=1 Tax=Bythopirellula polymerisocia TaxID=2528003 RepID=A0A5C6CBK7_9BACT|nr:hypothetical protein [Bythopirellula polymerisocia]TWU20804.1 hypothetical protein Pla144_48560 [Bythopirellula polymerisocia]